MQSWPYTEAAPKKIGRSQSEPYKWHIELQHALSQDEKLAGLTVIIDLKPKQNKENISLYELMDVWGYSDSGWSPILVHLHGLLVDEDPNRIDRNQFPIKDIDREGPIFEFMYLNGSVSDGHSVSEGQLVGRWTSPPASPTNAALLWPEPLRYFLGCISSQPANLNCKG